jgi:hypothetical protein
VSAPRLNVRLRYGRPLEFILKTVQKSAGQRRTHGYSGLGKMSDGRLADARPKRDKQIQNLRAMRPGCFDGELKQGDKTDERDKGPTHNTSDTRRDLD